ncbi:hypothetical protein [Nostoc sp.]|uniref:hypothetical protein n=1 Tax=Nostoc sp. TaxID=1180 RepID=UPI002FFD2241
MLRSLAVCPWVEQPTRMIIGILVTLSTLVGRSDLFFNFSGQDSQTASNNGQLFGVKFADYGSGLSTGVYQGVTAKSITQEHGGYSNLKWYYDWGWGQNNTQGTDLATAQDVFS